MKRRVNRKPLDRADEREKLIGLGKRSISKSYYPELKTRLEELEHFRAMLDRISDAIFVVDAVTGTILDASGSVQTMIGCEPSQIEGRQFRQLLPEHVARYTTNLFSTKTEHLSLETEFDCPDCHGHPSVSVELSIRTVEYQGKGRAIIVARDISERKRNEIALRKSHEELEQRVEERTRELDRANRAKSEFLSIVSHELRTPLTSVLGFAKIIRKKLGESIFPAIAGNSTERLDKEMATVTNNLEIIMLEGDRLTALINDVLDLAKMEANKQDFNRIPINPGDFIQQAMDISNPLYIKSGVEFVGTIEPDLPSIMGDSDRLVQVMVNLFSNAAKFTEHGSVTCRANLDGAFLRVSVADTGIGIPVEKHAAIFDKFTQAKDTLSDRPKGTGLGLPICRNIIEGHLGKIWVESLEKGTRFVFTIPVMT